MTRSPLLLTIGASAVLAACVGVKTNPLEQKDAAVDGKPDAPIDAPLVLTSHRYIMDKQIIPTTSTQARNNGLDLNGDATVDNQLGMVMGTFAGQGFDVQGVATSDVDKGKVLALVQLEANSFANGPARFTLFFGESPSPPACNGGADTVCRHHLTGTGSFIVNPASPHDPPLSGTISNTAMLTTATADTKLPLVVTLMSGGPVKLNLIAARAQISSASTGGIMTGIIGGGIATTEVDAVLIPAWTNGINAVIARDCGGAPPSCGCAAGSEGKAMQSLFDTTPKDCAVTVTELQNNSLIQSLLAPDLNIAGQQALSLGIGFTAVAASYTP